MFALLKLQIYLVCYPGVPACAGAVYLLPASRSRHHPSQNRHGRPGGRTLLLLLTPALLPGGGSGLW